MGTVATMIVAYLIVSPIGIRRRRCHAVSCSSIGDQDFAQDQLQGVEIAVRSKTMAEKKEFQWATP